MSYESSGKLIFVTGGARSGKSRFAEALAASLGKRVAYVATCTPLDDEMKARVALHRERRPPDWITIEEPWDVAGAMDRLGKEVDVILVDCLTLLVSNLLFARAGGESPGAAESEILEEINRLARISKQARAHVVVVSNEVGSGIVPEYPLGRIYRDLLGRANQTVASLADEVYLCVAGIPIEIKASGMKVLERIQEWVR